jgi:ribosome-associated protein
VASGIDTIAKKILKTKIMIKINDNLAIPENELTFTASASSGPGGQHVNKTSTRVTLWFDVANSLSLSPEQKIRIYHRLATRINRNGVMRVSAQRHRSQAANRDQTIQRFAQLIADALEETPQRLKTKVPVREKKLRLEKKKHKSLKKQLRSKVTPDDG